MPTACRLLEKTYTNGPFTGRRLKFKSLAYHTSTGMTLDEKIRVGIVALSGASVVMAALGVKLPILEIANGSGLG
jgi:hypothetical protein